MMPMESLWSCREYGRGGSFLGSGVVAPESTMVLFEESRFAGSTE